MSRSEPTPPGVTSFGGTAAVAVAVLACLALGAGLGVERASALALVGAALLVAAAAGAERPSTLARVAGSLAVPPGVCGVVAGAWLAGGARAGLVAVGALGVVVVGLDAKTAYFRAPDHDIVRTVGSSAVAAVAVVAALGALAIAYSLVPAVATAYSAATGSRFALLVVLQVEALVVVGLLGPAAAAVSRWTRSDDLAAVATRAGTGAIGRVFVERERRYYAGLLVIQVVLAVLYPGTLDVVLSALPVVGPAVGTALDIGLFHRPLEGIALALGAVITLEACRSLAASWAEPDPLPTVARGAGGATTAGVVALAGVLPWTAGAVADATPPSGPAHPLVVVLVPMSIGYLLLYVPMWLGNSAPSLPRGVGFTAGAVALFACALGGALAGIGTALAVGVAAAAFVVHDTGSTGARLGATVGTDADTVRGEFVRTGASVGVGLGAVAVATVARYGSASISVPQWRGYLALALALVALSAFALSLVQAGPDVQ